MARALTRLGFVCRPASAPARPASAPARPVVAGRAESWSGPA
ncbi:hypothetical protein [Streptomyces sp. NBC_00996]|nr:hypothetical protein OG390_26790 [Streptomyces sp. NBC_00996]